MSSYWVDILRVYAEKIKLMSDLSDDKSICFLDFNIGCETSAVQEWILFSLDSSVELIMIFC